MTVYLWYRSALHMVEDMYIYHRKPVVLHDCTNCCSLSPDFPVPPLSPHSCSHCWWSGNTGCHGRWLSCSAGPAGTEPHTGFCSLPTHPAAGIYTLMLYGLDIVWGIHLGKCMLLMIQIVLPTLVCEIHWPSIWLCECLILLFGTYFSFECYLQYLCSHSLMQSSSYVRRNCNDSACMPMFLYL